MHGYRGYDRETKTGLAKSKKRLALMQRVETLQHASGSVHRFIQYREWGEGRKL